MTPAPKLVLMIFLAVLVSFGACGRKKAPFLPKRSKPPAVNQLTGEWRDEDVVLSGGVQGKGKPREFGCIIYHARYDLENAPCEDCPIQMTEYKRVNENVISDGRFTCLVAGVRKEGIHYFRVRLIDRRGAIGPLSNAAKVVIGSGNTETPPTH